jgi:hypothetical protein
MVLFGSFETSFSFLLTEEFFLAPLPAAFGLTKWFLMFLPEGIGHHISEKVCCSNLHMSTSIPRVPVRTPVIETTA